MNYFAFLLLLALPTITFADEFNVPTGWAYEIGFNNYQQGSGTRALIESHELWAIYSNGKQRKDSYSILYGIQEFNDAKLYLNTLALGLRIRRNSRERMNASYMDILALRTLSDLDKKFSKDELYAAQLSFGLEIPYISYSNPFRKNDKFEGYFFIEGGWIMGFPEPVSSTDPELNKGVYSSIGFKGKFN